MNRKIIVSIGLSLVMLSALFAGGKKDTVDTPAEGLDSWLETVDITQKKPGKYNILITAEDLAGNTGLAGPYNMFIDPDSDLPVTRVTNPLEQMRVPGNLNIVGTCIDDDAVDYVELLLDDAVEPVRADGKEFWSYYLDTNGLAEGAHTIQVYGVDTFGVKGRPYVVTWNLDRNRPESEVTNLTMGALVSRRFTLSGKVTDGNGIRELFYSIDSGVTFSPLPLKFNKREGLWEFNVNLDSTKMTDGPSVCWFKAVDGQGSEGIYTFLYFVDNTNPTVGFISPVASESVNGVFAVTGFAEDAIGVQSLSWKLGRETGEFELIKGNPYWYKEFDLRGGRERSVEIEITAVDTAGNKTVAKRRILVDQAADVPAVTVTTPASGQFFEDTVRLAGIAADDDDIAEIWYSVNKGPPNKIDSSGVFGVELAGIPAGRHNLEVWPVDVYGIRGVSVQVPFAVAGPPPAVQFKALSSDPIGIHVEKGSSIAGNISSAAGIKAAAYQISGMPLRPLTVRSGTTSLDFTIPVTADFPYGVIGCEIVAIDIYDRETRSTQVFYTTNLAISRGAAPEYPEGSIRSSREIVIPASGKVPASTGTAGIMLASVSPGDIPFENGMSVTLSGPGWPKDAQKDAALRVTIDSPVAVTGISWTLNKGTALRGSVQKTGDASYTALIPLKALTEAGYLEIAVTATFRDTSTISASGYISVLRPSPTAGIFDQEQLSWGPALRNPANAILLQDGATAQAIFNGKPGLFARSVRFDKPIPGLDVALEGNKITVSGTRDGEYKAVRLVIQDTDGKEFTTAPETYLVDSALPVIELDAVMDSVWRRTALAVRGRAADSQGIKAVEYSLDNGTSWRPLANKLTGAAATTAWSFDESINIETMEDGRVEILVRAVDNIGRSVNAWRVYQKDTLPPDVETILPAPGDIVNGETRMAFRIADAGVVVKAEYHAPGNNTEWQPLELSALTTTMVGTYKQPLDPAMQFRFTDAAGNALLIDSWLFTIDAQADLPIVEIHLPAENDVIRKDFVVSGVVYDDDSPAKIWYKIDNGTFTEVPIEYSFSIPIALRSLTDNEHSITVYAEDIHGVRGPEVVRRIRVSLEEPKASVLAPSFEKTNRGALEITGVASDRNGIEKVEVSLDNGNSFNLAVGTEQWKYQFDTRVIQDGTHVVFIKVWDKYGTTGLYSSLINIDNTAPNIRLELPLDGSRTGEMLFISGQTLDNIGLEQVMARISNIDPKQPPIPAAVAEIPFENELIISRGIDVSVLPEGFYNVEVRGFDKAGNITRVSRNFEVYKKLDRNRIEFLYPLNGEQVQGMFNIYGRVVSEDQVESLGLVINGENAGITTLLPSGYFKFTVTPEMLGGGTHQITIRALLSGDKIITSEPHTVLYKPNGPWITIDSFAMGDFAIDRPWLMGTTGYSFTEEEVLALRAKDTNRDVRRELQAKTLEKVEISFDNGKTFQPTESGRKWRYRIETGDLAEGYHFMILRATMMNGETVVTRSIVQVDKTSPVVKLISPGEGGRYNNELVFSGLSSDDVQLDSVMLSLRPGDKSAYAVPAFIQGLYFDWHFWGATLYDLGLGLTFFDDNVKLQAQFGQFTAEQRSFFTTDKARYGGNVFGIKLLANLAYVPMEYYLGPDFSWLSATAAVGANFSYFSETQSGKPQILSAVLAQIEFPRITIPKRETFRTFSLYTEGQLWFIPTDVDAGEVAVNSLVPHVTGGIRINLF